MNSITITKIKAYPKATFPGDQTQEGMDLRDYLLEIIDSEIEKLKAEKEKG